MEYHGGHVKKTKLVTGRVRFCLNAKMSKLFLEPNQPLRLGMLAVKSVTSSVTKQTICQSGR